MAALLTLHKPWSSKGKCSTIPPTGYPTKMLLNTISTTSSCFPFFFNSNLTHDVIIPNIMPISSFLVYYGFDVDLDAITIYRHIKTLPDFTKPAIQALLIFLSGCMTSRLVNDMETFIPSRIFMESTPPAARTWGINNFNITFPMFFGYFIFPINA